MSTDLDEHKSHDLEVKESRPKLQEPPKYQVVLLNDDYTPMDFVVEILIKFFSMEQEQATRIMMHVHTKGKGVCGVFTRDVAETRKMQINEYARRNQHPLKSEIEKL